MNTIIDILLWLVKLQNKMVGLQLHLIEKLQEDDYTRNYWQIHEEMDAERRADEYGVGGYDPDDPDGPIGIDIDDPDWPIGDYCDRCGEYSSVVPEHYIANGYEECIRLICVGGCTRLS